MARWLLTVQRGRSKSASSSLLAFGRCPTLRRYVAVATLDREPAATAGASTVSFVGADDDLRYSPWFVARAQLPREGDECGCCDGFEGEHALAAVAVTSVVCDGVAVLRFTMLYYVWCMSEDGSGVCIGDNTLSVVSELSAPSVHRFDAVLTPDVTQAQTFDYVRPLLQSALEGYNATIFAYGQTVRSCVCLVVACILTVV